ncbi:MAG: hypothetical protein ACFB0A_15660 [Croceivirga sp.]
MVKTIDIHLEIFPSIILPSYSKQVDYSNNPTLIKQALYGFDKKGKLKKIDHRLFFHPIPVEYSNWIINRNLGLLEEKVQTKKTGRLGISYIKRPKTDSGDIIETKKWIKERLQNQGCLDSIIIIRKNRITLSRGSHNIKGKKLVEEIVLQLYE